MPGRTFFPNLPKSISSESAAAPLVLTPFDRKQGAEVAAVEAEAPAGAGHAGSPADGDVIMFAEILYYDILH